MSSIPNPSGSGGLTAFVFAGGGSLGACEVGMLRELLDQGVRPDCVIGASAGAINAAYFARHPDTDGVAMLEGLWRQIRRRDVMPFTLRGFFQTMLGRRSYLVEPTALRTLLEKNLSQVQVEHAAIPLHIVATDMHTGNEIVLSSGPLVDAVLASTAIPGMFPPVRIGGTDLIDGGVANNTPISVAVALGATRIFVLPAGFACAPHQSPGNAISQAMHAVALVIARQLVRDLESYASRAEIFVVPPLCPLDVSPYDYGQCGRLIEQAAAKTRAWMSDGGLERALMPGELSEYMHAALG